MTPRNAWQLAALAALVAALLWWKRGSIAPALASVFPAIGGAPALLTPPTANTSATDYGPPRSYVGDSAGGNLPQCNGCGPFYSTRFYGTAMEQAAALSARS